MSAMLDFIATMIGLILGLAIAGAILAVPIVVIVKAIQEAKARQLQEYEQEKRRLRSLNIFNVDAMAGVQFENFIRAILESHGYAIQITKASGDQGVDLIGTHGTRRIAVQCKRYSRPVSRHAISDVVAGMAFYGCNEVMVVTNSYFTKGAQQLAGVNRCTLVDRNLLADWITQFSNQPTLPNILSPSLPPPLPMASPIQNSPTA